MNAQPCPHERVARDDEDLHPYIVGVPAICRDCGAELTLIPKYDDEAPAYRPDENGGSTATLVSETPAESIAAERRRWDEERARESRNAAIREGIVLPKWAK